MFSTEIRSPPIAVATNSSGYIAATTLIEPDALLSLSEELHPERMSPSATAIARLDKFFLIISAYSLIDNDSN
jgi:hypothetical protein